MPIPEASLGIVGWVCHSRDYIPLVEHAGLVLVDGPDS